DRFHALLLHHSRRAHICSLTIICNSLRAKCLKHESQPGVQGFCHVSFSPKLWQKCIAYSILCGAWVLRRSPTDPTHRLLLSAVDNDKVERVTRVLVVVRDRRANEFLNGLLRFEPEYALITLDRMLAGHSSD